MNPIDLAVIVIYVVGCTALGAWMGARASGLKGYFLGESNIPAWAVMVSIVATETSTATFLSVPGVAYKGDCTFLQLPLGYILGRILVATLLLPSYFRGEIFTAYQVLERRFGGATRTTASILFLVTRTLADGLRLFLAAKVLEIITGWPISGAILALGLTTIAYTYLGGMKAVIWTDVIQFAIYITGALIALYILVGMLPGGMEELLGRAQAAHKFRMFNFSLTLKEPFTFWAGLVGGMVLNTATHGADQMMVQRYLSARSRGQATGALLASGFVILAQFALFLFIGVSLYVFYQDYAPRLAPDGGTLKPDEVFAYFIVHYLPAGGILGLVVAALFSAAMGTLSGSLNASASTTVNDLYRPLVPNADEGQLLRLSRTLTAGFGALQMAVAAGATRLEDSVVNNALRIASFTTGLVLGLFLLGILTRKVGQSAALVGLLSGLAAVSAVAYTGLVAWPWYALVGSCTVFLAGNVAARVRPLALGKTQPVGLQPDLLE
jgi:SSS family transporter